ncbi:hypothetical protein HG570_05915 [Helicobacter pylori]|nr:hypothetical protein [Helicobacter pylori]QQW84050.1 hypothetical protein HG570_05915 [Helicobacter pylori]
MGSLSHILVSILVVVLGLAIIARLWYRIMECIDEVRRGSWLTQILTGFGLWGWLTKGSASFFTSLLAKLGLGSMFAGLGVVLAVPTLAGWLFGRSGLTAGERFWVFILGAFSLAFLVGMIYCGYGIITDFSALSATMWWWSLSKITWFYIGYAILCVLTLVMGSATCYKIEDYS